MASSLDMSLDHRIKNRSNRGRVRGRGRAHTGRGPSGGISDAIMSSTGNGRRSMNAAVSGGRMTGGFRRGPLMVNARPSSYTIAKSIRRTRPFPWRPDLFEDSIRAAGIQGIEVGFKLYVSNLDRGVTNEDIRELFAELGGLKRYAVHYDKNGHQSGSAEVVYTRRSDAFAALKRYNNVLLDGKPMMIEIVGGTNSELPITARVNVTGLNGQRKRTVVMTPRGGRGGPAFNNRGAGWGHRGGGRSGGGVRTGGGGGRSGGGRGRGHGRGRGRGRGGGRTSGKKEAIGEKSTEDLDKELDTYHAEAMHIS